MATTNAPLSPTVSAVFDAFLKKLEDEKVLDPKAREALGKNLKAQKLDAGSLRKAMFPPPEAGK